MINTKTGRHYNKKSFKEMQFRVAKELLLKSDWIFVVSGAGMSADSGIATYRGKNSSISKPWPGATDGFITIKPSLFKEEPELAWGYTYHTYNTITKKSPHNGYDIVKKYIERVPHVIVTTNIDGYWDSPNLLEYHGSIHYMQCSDDCHQEILPIDFGDTDYDEETGRLKGNIPQCKHCSEVMRPNIFYFGDKRFCGVRRFMQQTTTDRIMETFKKGANGVVIEIGCGTAVPTAREMTGRIKRNNGAIIIRINTEEYETDMKDMDEQDLFIEGTALSVLTDINLITF
jgi:NAD-dependent SIR2 family protein deacetylase